MVSQTQLDTARRVANEQIERAALVVAATPWWHLRQRRDAKRKLKTTVEVWDDKLQRLWYSAMRGSA